MENESQTVATAPADGNTAGPCRASKVRWGLILIAISVVLVLVYIIIIAFALSRLGGNMANGIAGGLMLSLLVLPAVALAAFLNGAMLAGIYNVAFCKDNDTMDKVAAGAGILVWVVFPLLK